MIQDGQVDIVMAMSVTAQTVPQITIVMGMSVNAIAKQMVAVLHLHFSTSMTLQPTIRYGGIEKLNLSMQIVPKATVSHSAQVTI